MSNIRLRQRLELRNQKKMFDSIILTFCWFKPSYSLKDLSIQLSNNNCKQKQTISPLLKVQLLLCANFIIVMLQLLSLLLHFHTGPQTNKVKRVLESSKIQLKINLQLIKVIFGSCKIFY